MTRSVAYLHAAAGTLSAMGPVGRSSVMITGCARLQAAILGGRRAAGTRRPSERDFALTSGQ